MEKHVIMHKQKRKHVNDLNKIAFLLVLDSDSAFLPGGVHLLWCIVVFCLI